MEGAVISCDKEQNLKVSIYGTKYTGTIKFDDTMYSLTGKIKPVAIMALVGKSVKFKIKDISETDGNVSVQLSRKEAQEEYQKVIKETVKIGDILEARVIDVNQREAFLDVGCGCRAILHRENISLTKLSADSILKRGQDIKIVVKDITDKGIVATHKELLGNFNENIELHNLKSGETIIGVITRIDENGIYIKVGQNIYGLAERSDIDRLGKLSVGDAVCVHIKAIIPHKVKVKLAILDKAEANNVCEDKLKYFIPKDCTHIEKWVYSPEGSVKSIISDFSEKE